jgi:hypothetical protein
MGCHVCLQKCNNKIIDNNELVTLDDDRHIDVFNYFEINKLKQNHKENQSINIHTKGLNDSLNNSIIQHTNSKLIIKDNKSQINNEIIRISEIQELSKNYVNI